MKTLKYFILVLLLTVQINSAQSNLILFETGSGDRPYKVYTALLTQTGTNAPVATVLENTLGGTVVWAYNNAGRYKATLAGAFITGKTSVLFGDETKAAVFRFIIYNAEDSDTDDILVDTSLLADAILGNYSNDVLYKTTIEIRVYP